MLGAFALQAVFIALMRFATSPALMVPIALFIALAYGANLALMPAATFDSFGTRHAGADYGLLFTAWGVGGILGTQVETLLFAGGVGTGPTTLHAIAFSSAVGLCSIAAFLAFRLRAPHATRAHSERPELLDI
jgi:hypothetical protein